MHRKFSEKKTFRIAHKDLMYDNIGNIIVDQSKGNSDNKSVGIKT